MQVGDKVYFRKLVKGHWKGVENYLYIIIEKVKFGEVDTLVIDPATNEKIYTNERTLSLAENVETPPQKLNLFTGEWEYC